MEQRRKKAYKKLKRFTWENTTYVRRRSQRVAAFSSEQKVSLPLCTFHQMQSSSATSPPPFSSVRSLNDEQNNIVSFEIFSFFSSLPFPLNSKKMIWRTSTRTVSCAQHAPARRRVFSLLIIIFGERKPETFLPREMKAVDGPSATHFFLFTSPTPSTG